MKKKSHISLIIMMFSVALLGSYHIYYSSLDKKEDELISRYIENTEYQDNIIPLISNIEEEYFGILEIPIINLKEGFYAKNSKNNNINKSVTLLPSSIMPDKENSIVYLAAHSGNGHLAYFKDLNKLSVNDIVYLNYNGSVFHYIVTDIYESPKNGNIIVNRNIHDDYLVLTTCSSNKNMQIVVVSKLFNKI